jgi:DNA-binding response OmpR family regulator
VRILIVEDSKRLRDLLALGLGKLGYAVDTSGNGEEALFLGQTRDYDVIVLDLTLPGLDGLDVLKGLRREGRSTHVLVLTARDTVVDRVRGLRTGADDYVVKPFAFDELAARIEALVRRRYEAKSPHRTVGELDIDTAARQVRFRGSVVPLTRRELAVLEYLSANRGRVVSRLELQEHVWGDRMLASNAVDSAVCCLRRKLGSADCPDLIATERGFGYTLRSPVAP